MIILGIETSCDETAAAVLQKADDKIEILSNIIASSASLQSKYGGIIPEQAAREQIKSIIPVINEALEQAKLTPKDLDAIAITYGPGLIGSLLVGVETAKVLSLTWDKPLIPVNHLLGHFYANWIYSSEAEKVSKVSQVSKAKKNKTSDTFDTSDTSPTFPLIGLLVSGGHTDLVLFKDHNNYQYLGGTRDDAAGECFDKCARLLDLPYPGGPQISKLAQNGDPKKYHFPRPMMDSGDFDFSYSGLKTSVSNLVSEELRKTRKDSDSQKARKSDKPEFRNSETPSLSESFRNDVCASLEQALITSLIRKTLQAAQKFQVQTIILGGGVSANQKLRNDLKSEIINSKLEITLHIPSPDLCTDNAAMIASRAFFEQPLKDPKTLQANPNLSLET